MTWDRVRKCFGYIIDQEVAKRVRRNDPNFDRDDYLQIAALAAWEYCRHKKEEDVDPRYVRARVYSALYEMAAKATGLHIGRNVFRKWASGELQGGIVKVVPLDELVEGVGDYGFTGNWYGQRGFEEVDTMLTVKAFISTLSPDEKRVLRACLDSGNRDGRVLSRQTAIGAARTRSAMSRLRRRCKRYFSEGFVS